MTNTFQVVVAAAGATVGTDLIAGQKFSQATYARKLSGFAVVGSAAIQDAAVELWAGEARKGVFYNTSAGAAVVPKKEDYKYPGALVPANSMLKCIVTDNAATNPLVVEFQFVSAKKRRFGTFSRTTPAGAVGAWRASSRYPTRASWQATRG